MFYDDRKGNAYNHDDIIYNLKIIMSVGYFDSDIICLVNNH